MSAINRIRKYKDKLTGFDGREVVHTGYKHSRNEAVRRYADMASFFALCDFLASQLCIENNLDVVECGRVFRFMRECCGETYKTGRTCAETLRECRVRFNDWVKCDEIALIVDLISRKLGCSTALEVWLESEFEVGLGTAEFLKGVGVEAGILFGVETSSLSRRRNPSGIRSFASALSRRRNPSGTEVGVSVLSLRRNAIIVETV